MKKFICSGILFIGLLAWFGAQSQGVAINNDNGTADPSAMLDVKSTEKGFLLPRMTHLQLNAIQNPVNGLLVYCIDCGDNDIGVFAAFSAGEWHIINLNYSSSMT